MRNQNDWDNGDELAREAKSDDSPGVPAESRSPRSTVDTKRIAADPGIPKPKAAPPIPTDDLPSSLPEAIKLLCSVRETPYKTKLEGAALAERASRISAHIMRLQNGPPAPIPDANAAAVATATLSGAANVRKAQLEALKARKAKRG